MPIEGLIDRSKGWYAIEMEVMKEQTLQDWIINKAKVLIEKYTGEPVSKQKDIRHHRESNNIEEFTIHTKDIKLKSDLYLAVGKKTRNNTHSPLGSDGYLSGGTHLHVFLTDKWWKYAKDNFGRIYANMLRIPLFAKVNVTPKNRVKLFHRNRYWLISTLVNVTAWQVLYWKSRGIWLSREFQSIEFRSNNVIHPFQFLYAMYILWSSDLQHMYYNPRLLHGDTKRVVEGPQEVCITRRWEEARKWEVVDTIHQIVKIMPKKFKQDKYWLDIIMDYLKTTKLYRLKDKLDTMETLMKYLNDLYNKLPNNDQNQSNRDGARTQSSQDGLQEND